MSNWETDEGLGNFITRMKSRLRDKSEEITAEELRLLPPLSKPGKAKKRPDNPWLRDGALAIRVASMHPLAPAVLLDGAEIDRVRFEEAKDRAIKKGDAEFWDAVAYFTRRAKAVFSKPDAVSHIAVYALRAKKALQVELGRLPTKREVAELVIRLRAEAGMKAPDLSDSAEWRKIYEAATLKYLPQERSGSRSHLR